MHELLNEIIWRGKTNAGFSAAKEAREIAGSDGRRRGGVTLIPRESPKYLSWDAATDTRGASYSELAGAAAEIAAERERTNHTGILSSYC